MIFLAVRYLLERRRQTFLTLLGVFFGTLAYVSVSGFFLGFQGYLVQQLVNGAPQIHIQAKQDYVTEHSLDQAFFGPEVKHTFWAPAPAGVQGYIGVQNPGAWNARLKADPRVEAFSPTLTTAALFTLGKNSVSASLIGCDPVQQSHVTTVSTYMTVGKFSDLASGGNRVILGAELMKRLGASVQQTVMVSVRTRGAVPFKVVGTFASGNRGADLVAYGALPDVQRVNATPNQVNEIGVRLKDYLLSDQLAESWSGLAPERVESWGQQNAHILSVFAIQTALRFSMILTVLIVAGFGIYNILNMTVNQKRQDIAILRAIGYDTFDVITLFFAQGMIVGVIGAALGLVGGYGLCRYLQTIPFMAGPGGNGAGHLLISLTPSIYIQACGMALLSTAVASILPARAAGKLTPIDIIRQGG